MIAKKASKIAGKVGKKIGGIEVAYAGRRGKAGRQADKQTRKQEN